MFGKNKTGLSKKERRIYGLIEAFVSGTIEGLEERLPDKPEEVTHLVRMSDFYLWPTDSREYCIFARRCESGVHYGICLGKDETGYCVTLVEFLNQTKKGIIWSKQHIASEMTRLLCLLLSYEGKN